MRKYNTQMLLNALKDIDSSLTVNQLSIELSEKLEKSKIEQIEAEQKVVDKYTDKYLVILSTGNLMGKEIEYIYIKSLKPGSMTTEWERTYDCEISDGFSFNERSVYNRDYKNHTCDFSYTESQLETYTEISPKEFFDMKSKHVGIKEQINSIINLHFDKK